MLENLYHRNHLLRTAYHSVDWLRKMPALKKRDHQEIVVSNLIDLIDSDPLLNIEEFNGKFYLDKRSHIFKRFVIHKNYEPRLVELCNRYINPARDVIDVGANIGLFTVLFAKKINYDRKILSIEPTKNARDRLNKNITINNMSDRVIIFDGVVSDQLGKVTIKTIVGKEEYSSIGNSVHPSTCGEVYISEDVNSSTIDELVKLDSIDPGFIKIDVEGCEHLVFKGGRQTLQNNRPIILSELSNFLLKSNGSSSAEVITSIEAYEYDVFDPITPYLKPGIKEFGDIICFPKEMNISFR